MLRGKLGLFVFSILFFPILIRGSNNQDDLELSDAIKAGEESFIYATTTEEDYEEDLKKIKKLIEKNDGSILSEKNKKVAGLSEPLNQDTIKVEFDKDKYKEFKEDFNNLEGEGKALKIKTRQDSNSSDKEIVTLILEGKIDIEKISNIAEKGFRIVLFLFTLLILPLILYKTIRN